MRVGFDARMITHPGIGTYIRNLVSAMSQQLNKDELVLFGDPDKLFEFKNVTVREYKTGIYGFKELFLNPYKKESLDLVHVPHFNAPLTRINNLVITIHDLIYLKFDGSSSFVKKAASKLVISNAIKNASKIIAVSENTRRDIQHYFPLSKGKIEVIYEDSDPVFLKNINSEKMQEIKKKYNLPDKIILFVGTLKKHKNIERLVDAYLSMKKRGIEHLLVVIGRYRPQEPEILKKINSSGAVYLGEVPLDDLIAIYNFATVLVIPSLYEGFGLPALEAMTCGLPVAASCLASLPEVIGEAGVLFNPYDVSDMANKIIEVLVDEKLRQGLIKKGRQRLEKFSWQKTAQETLGIYREVVNIDY
ncbi:MAG: glycosyltransferase family 4 protein [Candidatus Omnitrophica bacterium]|nr:glycosyltransferase family 4 protein [Candidatus Omnitrophota bacterium]